MPSRPPRERCRSCSSPPRGCGSTATAIGGGLPTPTKRSPGGGPGAGGSRLAPRERGWPPPRQHRDRDRRVLTDASYEQLGGVAGALATHADTVIAGLSASDQALARSVLERLVTPERTRAVVSVTELRALRRDPDDVDRLLQHLAAMRLVVVERAADG